MVSCQWQLWIGWREIQQEPCLSHQDWGFHRGPAVVFSSSKSRETTWHLVSNWANDKQLIQRGIIKINRTTEPDRKWGCSSDFGKKYRDIAGYHNYHIHVSLIMSKMTCTPRILAYFERGMWLTHQKFQQSSGIPLACHFHWTCLVLAKKPTESPLEGWMTIGMPRLICEVVEQTLCWMNPVNGFRAILLSTTGAHDMCKAQLVLRVSSMIYGISRLLYGIM